MRLRTSTVKRFGGFSTASFCAESRCASGPVEGNAQETTSSVVSQTKAYSVLGW
jgi:CpeS-like protein